MGIRKMLQHDMALVLQIVVPQSGVEGKVDL